MVKTPVLFVPGITGSFNLPVLLDWRGPTLSGWDFPPFVGYGKQFVESFQKAGYVRDTDLFVAFYDWRKAVKDSAITYLKPWIDRAKQRSGQPKVILICHSMGGLVARSYIQSQSYAGDVAQLITVGTPHRGSAQAYYSWGSGVTRADQTTQTVFGVYLWYLRHVHPVQTELDPLRTMRTQIPAVRDLLPIDTYLISQGAAPTPKDEDRMVERNLWGDILNLPANVEALLSKVSAVTTLSGVGFSTIRQIVVGAPPTPPATPALYPDGVPISDQVEGDGDDTVLQANAQISHPRAKNLPSVNVSHGALPDHPAVLTQLFGELGVRTPALGAAPVQEPQLVIMTASPVRMRVQTPAGPPMAQAGVLGAFPEDTAPSRRSRRIRARDHGHSGKHLNIVVVPSPAVGSYKVQLDGTSTGGFALGAMLISTGGALLLGGDGSGEARPAPAPITTMVGQAARESELHYEVICSSSDSPPEIRLDAMATAYSTLRKLRAGVQAAQGGVLGGEGADPLGGVLGGSAGGDELRGT
ncbi:alpha/beta hydrolase, partial [Oscillochloris sp. ZM17-4]|uniref:lipase family alpha/beta hydrolase n=1 Tax=Oscillochloris sp. ZM17-4 TaxID=2866714 RepID=UPI001C73441C